MLSPSSSTQPNESLPPTLSFSWKLKHSSGLLVADLLRQVSIVARLISDSTILT